MERLIHIIEYEINIKWKPIKLNKNGISLSHLFFVGDLILFTEASLEQIKVVQSWLDVFCKASGERVNKEKTNMFYSRNIHPNAAAVLS